MGRGLFFVVLAMGVVLTDAQAQVPAAVRPEAELARIVQVFLASDFNNDWQGVEKVPLIRWAALPPAELTNCLPDGSCFTRQGTAVVGGKNVTAIAAGARSFALNLYLRNASAGFGEAAVVAALRAASFTVDLARCPVPGQAGTTNWYRLRSAKTNPGVLSVQTPPNGAIGEGFVVSQQENLVPLLPNQVRIYSEQCGPGVERKPVSTLLPHESLAQALAALIPASTAAALYDWKTLVTLSPIQWAAKGALKTDLSFMSDPNPFSISGTVTYASRSFSSIASGSETQVKVVYLEENGLHPRGEDLLAILRAEGFTVQLARCGPVYTESTSNWYRLTGARTRPVMFKQSIRRDGNQLQDSYALRLDNTLPVRDPRDRDPGVAGCQ